MGSCGPRPSIGLAHGACRFPRGLVQRGHGQPPQHSRSLRLVGWPADALLAADGRAKASPTSVPEIALDPASGGSRRLRLLHRRSTPVLGRGDPSRLADWSCSSSAVRQSLTAVITSPELSPAVEVRGKTEDRPPFQGSSPQSREFFRPSHQPPASARAVSTVYGGSRFRRRRVV